MATEKPLRQTLVALFFLGLVLFNYPVVSLFNRPLLVGGIPLFYLYLFAVWFGLVLLIGLATVLRSRRAGPGISGD